MKKIVFLFASLFYHFILIAQTSPSYQVSIGQEIKLGKKSKRVWLVTADNSNMYYAENWVGKLGATAFGKDITYYARLTKYDHNYNTIYEKEYGEKELKGHSFTGFRTLGNDLYITADEWIKKEHYHQHYIAKIDKNTGELISDLVEFERIETKDLGDYFDSKSISLKDGSGFFTINRLPDEEKLSFGLHFIDKDLTKKESLVMNLSFRPGYYMVKDLEYLEKEKKIIILGKEDQDDPEEKNKRKGRVLKNYVISVYNTVTKKLKSAVFPSDNKILAEVKLLRQPNGEIFLAGFYANIANWSTMNGFFIYKIDTETGKATLVSSKDIDENMLGNGYADEDDTKKYSKKGEKVIEDLVENKFGHFVIKSVEVNPADNSFILIVELSRHFSTSTTINNSNDRRASFSETYNHRFIHRDIIVIKADKQGNIVWMNNLPKVQVEFILSGHGGVNGTFLFSYGTLGYFSFYGDKPWFSSFQSMIRNNNLVILLNDHIANTTNGDGKSVRAVFNFQEKSSLYGISVDLATGRMDRKFIYKNIDKLTMLPRDADVIGNVFYIPLPQPHLLAKTDYRIGKVTVE